MNIIEYLRSMKERLSAKPAFDPQAALAKLQELPEGVKYLYYRTLPRAPANAFFNEVFSNFGQWTNAMEYDALYGGFGIPQLKYDPATGRVNGPNGILPTNARFEWSTLDGRPPAYLPTGRLIYRS